MNDTDTSPKYYVAGFQIHHPLVAFPDLYNSLGRALNELHQYPQHAPEILATIEAITSDGSVVSIPRRFYVESIHYFEDSQHAHYWLKSKADDPVTRLRYTEIDFNTPFEAQLEQAMSLKRDRLRAVDDLPKLCYEIEDWLGVQIP